MQCRKFVTKVLEVNLDDLQKEWEEITKFQTLRNSIAHKNGFLKVNNDSFFGFIQKKKRHSYDSIDIKVEIENDELLNTLIEKLVKFLVSVIIKFIEQKCLQKIKDWEEY